VEQRLIEERDHAALVLGRAGGDTADVLCSRNLPDLFRLAAA
jgi:hypothetical protein